MVSAEPPTIPTEDVDDIIGAAAKEAQAAPNKLTITELVDIGNQLGIERAAVERAATELEARRAAERTALESKARLRKRVVRGGLIGLAGLGGVLIALTIMAFVGKGGLESELARIEQARSQVDNVVQRRAEVRARVAAEPGMDPDDRSAELAGSDNRVAVEKRRFDEAATRYNVRVASFPGSTWAALFGLPERIALSRESVAW